MLEILEEKYGLINKSTWKRGEWDKEPDFVRLVDGINPFMIRRGPDSLGHLCGYFGVFEPDPMFGKGYDDVQRFEVELTFAGLWWDQSSLIWWFGWDHAHAGDLVPGRQDMEEECMNTTRVFSML